MSIATRDSLLSRVENVTGSDFVDLLLVGAHLNDLAAAARGKASVRAATAFDTVGLVAGVSGVNANTVGGGSVGAQLGAKLFKLLHSGDEVVRGSGGNDVLTGGGGSDTFVFDAPLGSDNIDLLADFSSGTDTIQLDRSVFSALVPGNLAAERFATGTAATTSLTRIIYNPTTGAVFYDADGTGAGAAVQFATLGTGLNGLTSADFKVSGAPLGPPSFTSGTTGSVSENAPTSTVVYDADASDAAGNAVFFRLSGADASLFTIDNLTGEVRLKAPADYETRSSYSLTVEASDTSGTFGSRSVTVSVIDVSEGPSVTPIVAEAQSLNDVRAQAQALSPGTFAVAPNADLDDATLRSLTINGAISVSSDKDYYAVTLQAGEKLILDVDGSGTGLDALLTIFGPDGAELGSVDDSKLDPGSAPHPSFTGQTLDPTLSFRATAAGTYYFAIESFNGATSGTYKINVSIAPPGTPAQITAEDIQAVLSGSSWSTTSLTYGFPTLASQYSEDTTGGEERNNFEGFSVLQQTVTRSLLMQIANVTNLTFTENASQPGQANLRYGMSDLPDVAYAYEPSGSPLGGSAWFNNTSGDFDSPVIGNYAYMSILHETGHTLGLKHGHEFPPVSTDHDSIEYTVMTYRSFPGANLDGYTPETWGYAQSLMQYDIAALQKLYGADFGYNATNTTYTFSTTTGQMSINGAGQGTPGGNRIFRTVWDGGGTDTYDLSNYTNGTTIDLRPGEWTTTSQTQLANLGLGHYARGNVANALQFNGDARSLIENAIGGSGADIIIGNQAINDLTGGAGADTFRWMTARDTAVTSTIDPRLDPTPDIVRGFNTGSGHDWIDLSAIDANSAVAGDQGFTYIGNSSFFSGAGQLRWQVDSQGLHLYGDTDGDRFTSEIHILLTGLTSLPSADIIL